MIQHLIYVDPGSGSYLVQAIVAGVTGAIFFFKNVRMYVRDKFQRILRKKSS